VLGFASHADDRRAHRVGGLAYTAGVVLSFLALGALMLGLRAAGEQLGWGFQLQSPLVVALLATLFTVIGLNLAGVFEFGQFLPGGVASLEARHPTVNAALSGVLAVAVASPCTAPVMGASLGLAVGLPALQALSLFAALGLGMALPYLLASWLPALARALPRPGAWMDTFKKFMAFPMFGTAVWLLWVLGQQSGIDGAAALLALLVLLAFALWVLGLAGRTRWWLGGLTALLALLVLPSLAPHVVAQPAGLAQAASAAPGARWQPWSAERVQALLAEGRPVFVDYTAAWCVTCQYNKKTTLASAEVLAAFDAAGVQTLRADWTRRDPAISAELQKLGRSGVPVYVLQAPGQAPRVLSEILSVGEVRQALAVLRKS
jgi:thiol:disulfide interchange protein DsbD